MLVKQLPFFRKNETETKKRISVTRYVFYKQINSYVDRNGQDWSWNAKYCTFIWKETFVKGKQVY